MVATLLASFVFSGGEVFSTSQIDITPPEELPLGGYTTRGEELSWLALERLYSRTLLLQSGDLKVALTSVEMLTIPESLLGAVRERVDPSIELMLVATHTHSAPDSQMLNERMTFKVPGIATFKRRWLNWYADKIAEGIKQAADAPARDATGLRLKQTRVDVNHGRRKGSKPDTTATWITSDGKPLVTVYSAHGTVVEPDNFALNGDWPGAYAEAEGGLVLPGAIGDVAPGLKGMNAVDNLTNIVEKLTAGFARARVLDLMLSNHNIVFVSAPIALSSPVPHPDFGKENGISAPLDQVVIDKFAPPTANVSVLRIGRLLVVGIPGEPTAAIGREVQKLGAKYGFPHTVAVSHCNGWIGYVLEPKDYDRGGYEATLAFHGRETSNRILEAVESAVSKLAQSATLSRAVHVR